MDIEEAERIIQEGYDEMVRLRGIMLQISKALSGALANPQSDLKLAMREAAQRLRCERTP